MNRFEELVFIGMGRTGLELLGDVDVKEFVRKCRGRPIAQDAAEAAGAVSGFFTELSPDAGKGVFSACELPCRDFVCDFADRVAVLPDHDHRVLVEERHDGHGSGMSSVFTARARAVGQPDEINMEVYGFPMMDQKFLDASLDKVTGHAAIIAESPPGSQ